MVDKLRKSLDEPELPSTEEVFTLEKMLPEILQAYTTSSLYLVRLLR